MAEVLHVGAAVSCAHQVPASGPTGAPRVRVGGREVWTTVSTLTVAGCPFAVATKPQPCVTVVWGRGASRVRTGGQPLLLRDSVPAGTCRSAEQVVQGVPSVTGSQTRVRAR